MPNSFKGEIALSWERCCKAGLRQEEGFCQIHPLYSPGLGKERQRFRKIALPLLETLFEEINEYRFMLMLTDENSILLDYRCNPSSEQGLVEMNFRIGTSMAEKDVGTNGIGTAIAANRPMIVYGEEHYCHTHQSWATFGVPVHNERGEIVGCIGCSEHKDFFHSHTLGMLMALAKAVEEQIKLEKAMQDISLHSKLLNRIIESISDGLIYFSTDGQIQKINDIARQMLGRVDTPAARIEDVFTKDLVQIVGDGNGEIIDEEMNLKNRLKCFITATPVEEESGELSGVVTLLKRPADVHSLANKVAGTRACYKFTEIIGAEPRFLKTLELAQNAAQSPSSILLQGESGTGKELVAQAIHNASNRRQGPFIAINCSAIPKSLLESELFGYEEGTFTGALKGGKPGKFELACGGTVLLDEIGDMPLNMQAALLRVLQEKSVTRLGSAKSIPVDIRVIASTNKEIHQMVKKGTFREDLYYRLNVVNISLPPLRERKDDIPLLVDFLIDKMNLKLNKRIRGIAPACMEWLIQYEWPGNIRELENIIEYCVNICEDNRVIERSCLPDELKGERREEIGESSRSHEHITLEELERWHIETVLQSLNGNKMRASRVLGIDRGTLYNKIKRYNLDPAPGVCNN